MGYGDLDPHSPAVGADGTLAFVGSGETGPSLFVDEGSGPVAVASLGEECPGQRPSFAPSATAIAFVVSAPDCASSELRVLAKVDGTYVGATSELVATSAPGTHYETASWRPATPDAAAFRLAGKDRIATGIAVSEWNYTAGAEGAVIASATDFPDAVVGGPLAAQLEIPLLLTNPKSLDSRVAAHLKTLTEGVADPFVYIIGSAGAVSAAVERSLVTLGYDVLRIAGPDRYATSVEVARTLDAGYAAAGYAGPRSAAFLADGRNFPDALSAGPAAAQLLASVLLTNGTSVPAVVRSYVNGRASITTIHSVGRSAAQASGVFGTRAAGNSIVGSDRYETSALTARTFFAAGAYIGYASGENFPDALTGGAMMGSIWEPLVLVRPTTVPTTVRSQARELPGRNRRRRWSSAPRARCQRGRPGAAGGRCGTADRLLRTIGRGRPQPGPACHRGSAPSCRHRAATTRPCRRRSAAAAATPSPHRATADRRGRVWPGSAAVGRVRRGGRARPAAAARRGGPAGARAAGRPRGHACRGPGRPRPRRGC